MLTLKLTHTHMINIQYTFLCKLETNAINIGIGLILIGSDMYECKCRNYMYQLTEMEML